LIIEFKKSKKKIGPVSSSNIEFALDYGTLSCHFSLTDGTKRKEKMSKESFAVNKTTMHITEN
jgi:hypothetical protein